MLTVLNKTGIDVDLTLIDAESRFQKTLGANDYIQVQPDNSATHVDVRVKNTSGAPYLLRGNFDAKYYGDTLYVLTVTKDGNDFIEPLEPGSRGNGWFVGCSGGQLVFDRRPDPDVVDMLDNYDYSYSLVCETRGLTEGNILGTRPIACSFNVTNLMNSIMYIVLTILVLLLILLAVIAAIVWLTRR